MDIHSICRICVEYLQNGSTYYDLFLVPGLAKKLCMCTSLSVKPKDGFPKNICGDCYTRLSDMAEFQKLCADSVQKFQERVGLKRLYGRLRSRSPTTTSARRHSPSARRRVDSPTRKKRSVSRDRHRRHSPYHRSSRDHRSRRSRSRSKSRTPRKYREHHKHSSRERDKEQTEPPLIIPVPANYAYRFSGWTTPQSPWPTITSFPMMPPLTAAHQAPYVGLPPPMPYGPIPIPYRPRTFLRYPTPSPKKPST